MRERQWRHREGKRGCSSAVCVKEKIKLLLLHAIEEIE